MSSSLIIMPKKAVQQIIVVDMDAEALTVPQFTATVNALLAAGWSLDGAMVVRGSSLSQRMSKICEIEG